MTADRSEGPGEVQRAELDRLRALSADDHISAQPFIDEISNAYPRDLRVQAALNAYRAAIEYDTPGAVTPRARGGPAAVIEVNELVGPMLRFEVARRALDAYRGKWPRLHGLNVTETMMPDGARVTDGFRDDPRRDVQVAPKPGATTTFAVFTGRRHKFGVSLNLMHHGWFSPLGVNVIYLRDFQEALYIQGIKSVGGEDATLAALKGIVASLGTTRLVCLGNSGGVFGAWYYAVRLGAQHVLNFSGPSSIEIGIQMKPEYYDRFRELHERNLIAWPDIRALYAAHPQVTAEVFFGGDHEFDRAQAEHMAGLPNVRLEPAPGFGKHFVVGELVRAGRFGDVLKGAVAAC